MGDQMRSLAPFPAATARSRMPRLSVSACDRRPLRGRICLQTTVRAPLLDTCASGNRNAL